MGRIAIYVRESTKGQVDNGYNIDTQTKKCKLYMSLYNLCGENEMVDYYIEAGRSAKTNNRPQLNELLAKVKKGYYEKLVVYKLDRLVRRNNCWQEVKQILDENKVAIHSVSEKIDTSTAIGRFLVNIIVSSAELEQDTISERTNDGLTEGAAQGNYIIGGKAPFGYARYENKDGKKLLKQVEEEVVVLKDIQKYLRCGYSPNIISMLLKESDYYKLHGRILGENAITNIIHNKIYKGVMVFKDMEYRLDIDSVFSDAEWQEMQEILSTRCKTSKYEYLFTSKVFTSSGSPATRKSTVKKTSTILYYFDTRSKQRINEKDITEQVVSYMQSNKLIYKKERNKRYETDIRKLNDRSLKLNHLYTLSRIEKATYDAELKKIGNERKKITKFYSEYVENVSAYFNNLSYEEKTFLIEKYVNRIEVDFASKQVLCVS